MNKLIHPDTTIWCDMDGVVAVYDADGFQGKNPPYLVATSHYFRWCQPDEKIINALKLLQSVYHIRIKLISNVSSELKQEHKADKKFWIKQHMPFIDTSMDYNAITISKADFVKKLKKQKLKSTDILISDFNQDLEPWKKEGGTAIKYANGINNPHSYIGPHIPQQFSTKQIVNYLIDIIYDINKATQKE